MKRLFMLVALVIIGAIAGAGTHLAWTARRGNSQNSDRVGPEPSQERVTCESCIQETRRIVEIEKEAAGLREQVAQLKDSLNKVGVQELRPFGTIDLPANIRLVDPRVFRTWEAFYAHARAWKLTHQELTEAILVRIAAELALDDRRSRTLKALVLGEQEELALYAAGMASVSGDVDKAISDESFRVDIGLYRDDLRAHNKLRFLQEFSESEMNRVDAELRNGQPLVLRKADQSGAARVTVEGGVGR